MSNKPIPKNNEEQTETAPPTDPKTNPATGAEIDNPLAEPTAPAETEPKKVIVPKQNTRDTTRRNGKVQRKIENADVEKMDVDQSDISLGRSINPSEAVAYAMTQADPVDAVKRLVRESQLSDHTETYKLMEDKGFPMS